MSKENNGWPANLLKIKGMTFQRTWLKNFAARAEPCPSLYYPPSPQESVPLAHILCLIPAMNCPLPSELEFIINPKKYCTFQIHALCVRARTMHRLEMHLMFCYYEFWIYLHIFSILKSILLCKIMFTATPIQFILYLHSTFQSPEGGRLIEVGLY